MSENLNTKEYIRKLVNIAYINIAVPLLFFIWVYLESGAGRIIPMTAPEAEAGIFAGTAILGAVLVIIGQNRYQFYLKQGKKNASLYDKLMLFRKGMTVRFIAYGLAATLFVGGYYVTDYGHFTILFGLMIVLFSIHSPNARRVAGSLKLDKKDRLIVLEGLDIPQITH